MINCYFSSNFNQRYFIQYGKQGQDKSDIKQRELH